MTSPVRLQLLLGVLLAVVPARAAEEGSLRWVPREVAFPVAKEAVLPHAPFVPPGTAYTRGEVELGPARAAAFFLEPRTLARVTVLGGEAGALRLARVLGPPEPPAAGPGPRALLEEFAETREGALFAVQPPGPGNVWLLWAEQPLRVRIERPHHDPGLLVWEDARARLLRWTRGAAPFPELPATAGGLALRQRLEAQALWAQALLEHPGATPALRRALPLWRTAEALREFERLQPPLPGLVAREALTARLEGVAEPVTLEVQEGEAPGAPYHRFSAEEGHWELKLKGPGVARFEARALLTPRRGEPGQLLRLAVSTGGAPRDVREERSVPVRVPAPEEGAFPPPGDWRRVGGALVGSRTWLTFELRPGEHTYRLDFAGGPALLRLGMTRRRPRLSEWWQGLATAADWQRAAEAALAGDGSPPAALLRQHAFDARASVDVSMLSPELRTPALLAMPSPPGGVVALTRALREVAGAPLPTALRAQLLVDGARRLTREGASSEALQLLSLLGPEASAGALLQAADVLAGLPALSPEALELALLERAWRLEPLRPEVRERYLAAFSRRTAWRRLPLQGEGVPLEPWRWLDARGASTEDLQGEPPDDAFWALGAGEAGMLDVPPAPAGRPALLRAYLETTPEAPGPAELSLGGKRFPLLGFTRLEALEVLVPSGRHPLRLEGPPTARLHLSLPLVEAPGPSTQVRPGWPGVAGERPLPFTLSPASASRPVRFELRGVGTAGPISLRVLGSGPPRWLHLEPGAPSTWSAPLGPQTPPASAPVVGVLEVPAGTHALSFLPEGAASLAVTVATRGPERAEAEPGAGLEARPPEALPGLALSRLRALSLALRKHPTNAGLRRARARLLLSLGEERLALGDLVPLVASSASDADLAALLAEATTVESPTHLALSPPTLTGPLLLRPGLSSPGQETGASLEQLSGLVRTWRREGVAGARTMPSLSEAAPHTGYLQARLLLEDGQPLEGARRLVALAQVTRRWELLLEAAQWLRPLLSGPPVDDADGAGTASLAFGIAASLEQHLLHPVGESLRAAAGRRTRWKRLEDVEESGGLVALPSSAESSPEEPLLLKRLLAGAPWPLHEGQALRPGGSSRMEVELTTPALLRVEVACAALEPDAQRPSCPVLLRVDSREPTRHSLPPHALQTLEVGPLPPGRHQLELGFPPEAGELAAEVRFLRAEREGGPFEVLPPTRTVSALLAGEARPVVFTVLGPAALRVEAWGHGDAPAPSLEARATPLPRGEPLATSFALPASAGVGRAPEPGQHLLLLPRREPYRVVLRPPVGRAAVLLALRVDREEPLPEQPARRTLLASAPPPPPPTAPLELRLAGPARTEASAGRLGTLSLLVGQGWEPRLEGEEEDAEVLQSSGTSVALAWRRALWPERLWVRAEPSLRLRPEAGPVLGARAEVGAQGLPLKLRLHTRAQAFTQDTREGRVWGLRGRLLVERLYHPALDWQVLPSLRAHVERSWLAAGLLDVDPQVATVYGLDHPQRLEARLGARWQPLQECLGAAFARVMSNEDLVTVDHLATGLSWHALLGARTPMPVRVELGYALAYHPADLRREHAFFRHQGALELNVHLWRGESGRLLLWGRDTVLHARLPGLEHTGGLGLRFDFSNGRGWRDLMPWEEEFELLLERRRWEVEDVR